MPGVPKGRACDACRKQKKKCDETQPSCSRCIRLNLQCVGSGKQRYKFQEEKRCKSSMQPDAKAVKRSSQSPSTSSLSSNTSQSPSSSPGAITNASEFVFKIVIPTKPEKMQIRLPPESPVLNPSNALSPLAIRFIHTISRTTHFRYNLWWTFGTFLEDVPRRLGTNEALDRSIEALTAAHSGFCGIERNGATVEALTKYSQALRTLRVYLDDGVHSQSSNTLCAVMVLLVCQAFLGQTSQAWSGHAEGAVLILKARKKYAPRDMFEKKLFLSLRGTVLFEGLLNDRINLTPTEWDELVRNEFDANTPEGRILQNLAKGPHLMPQCRQILQTASDPTNIYNEARTLYQDCKQDLQELRSRAVDNNASSIDMTGVPKDKEKFVTEFFHAHYQRTYGIGLVVTLFFNCILNSLEKYMALAFGMDGDFTVQIDANYLAEEVLALAERSMIYRPVGAGYLIICLTAAWAATSDSVLKGKLRVALNDYHGDFKVRDHFRMNQELEWTAEHLRLGVSFRDNGERYYPGT
ncbi:hypothetical protein N7478_003168 [Penicillium angulare]|uniref:uncharacterized protein n=1 Tax=Penicillium angulare TaxID=116970 RepID=UPI00253F6EF4|nr:uncharacterized protein N7478_003168 [Penicillium angulare]KAJ5287482.1 hypothetical protein N7478_003168 [Penicillium angulare]